MNELQELCKAGDELNNALRNIGSDNILWFDKYQGLIVDVLQDAFNDKENDWIGYAIYELDWFKNINMGRLHLMVVIYLLEMQLIYMICWLRI